MDLVVDTKNLLQKEDQDNITWKYFPQTKHAYTLMGLRDTEQHFSKSKSRFCTDKTRQNYNPGVAHSNH